MWDPASEAEKAVTSAKEASLVLRVMGGCAVKLHSPKSVDMLNSLGRKPKDVDLVTHNKNLRGRTIERLLDRLGYTPNERWNSWHGNRRQVYFYEGDQRLELEVWDDKFELNHKLNLSNRLEIDYPTISLSDLLLLKMQVVKITEKDLVDALILLNEHELGVEEESDRINVFYIAKILSREWGFWYTFTRNISMLSKFVSEKQGIPETVHSTTSKRIDEILKALEQVPKSSAWKMRERIGTRMPWYTEVID